MSYSDKNHSKKLLVFAGTTEGREFFFSALKKGFDVTASVATSYGEEDLKNASFGEEIPAERARILTGRLDEKEMKDLLEKNDFFAVIDATHPFAPLASQNILCACESLDIPYYRLKRNVCFSCNDLLANSREFSSVKSLCNFLADTKEPCYSEGNIFISTGSKEIAFFSAIPNFASRVWVRVLPSLSSIEKCKSIGLPSSHIIAMQGPFSQALNEALFREFDIKILVTKESGEQGGFFEKIKAAKAVGAITLMIKPPEEKAAQTYTENEILEKL